MGSGASTIVPANRLGQLLVEARHRQGTDLERLAARSDFTVGELSDFEAGHRVLNDRLVAQVTDLYELDCGPIIPQRAELTIDLNDNLLLAAGHALPLHSAAHDHILERYLSLVYVLRDRTPGSTLPLRAEDVAILSASLAERYELVEEQLLAAMEPERESVHGLVRWFKQRLWVPGAGAVVGAVSIGTLVMVSGEGDAVQDKLEELEPVPPPDGARASAAQFAAGIGLGPGTTEDGSTEATESAAVDPSSPQSAIAPTTTLLPSATSTVPEAADTAATVGPLADESPTAATAAVTDSAPTGATLSPEEMGRLAEAELPFVWQQLLPEWNIVYKGENPSFRGLTYPYEKTIEMFIRPGDTPESVAGILAHEIAHAFDVEYMDDSDRSAWLEARQIDDAPWWPDAYARDFATGAGDFAESFAYWAIADESSSELGGSPNAGQIALIESFLRDR